MNYERVDELLRLKGLSRRRLALLAGIAPSKMSVWFYRKTKRIPARDINAIADILDVPPTDIMHPDSVLDMLYSFMLETQTPSEELHDYSDDELLSDYHRLPAGFQARVYDFIKDILENLEEADDGERT